MKYIILVGDGMADLPQDALGGRTPLDAAHIPAMDAVVARGQTGMYWPVPEGLPAGSEIGNLSLFGYDPRACFTGRAPIEAAAQGIALKPDDVAFRCNLVALEAGVMRDFTSGHITSAEAAQIVATLNETLAKEYPITFYPGVSYRNLAVVCAHAGHSTGELVNTECTPPHNITDQPHEVYWPKGPAADLLAGLMGASQPLLAEHPVNQKRTAEGKCATTTIWLWGQGTSPAMELYKTRFGLSGAVISAVDLVKGLGVLAGLEVINIPGATGWVDTDYAGKVAAAIDALSRHDFVYVHVEAPDETSHQGKLDLKMQAIEDFDAQVVAPVLEYVDAHPGARLLVAPDHYTLLSTKGHYGDATPFAMCGTGIAASGAAGYCERVAAGTGVNLREGFELTQQFLTCPELDLR